MFMGMDINTITTTANNPPLFPAGSLAAGSTTEDRNIERWAARLRPQIRDAYNANQHDAKAVQALAAADANVRRVAGGTLVLTPR